ncbi:hypothetical protein BU25DRAFT_406224 [Macroventuria anomochaeta]|uniref:Uncharacterized protein n=1 Tax=Macroventuria anomochaeta TaxID=301207 RepID=A0ACB6SF33_9PLEO|nr:uncharacterized protein BU25DRAFT_406224 [Macroventuria anomochaeta]KAF2632931.1 hypothetical protein BU25DRAFT_406224 [Macroventuria anomochaeta]
MGAYNYDHATTHQESRPANHSFGRDRPRLEQEQSALRMYSYLPWELRHHIHTFCVQGSYDNEVVVRHSTGSKLALLVRQSIGTQSYQWAEDPILLQLGPDRIGMNAAREVLDTYYRTRTFKFVHEELGLLRSFLETDSFGLAIRPADHVRRLHLQIRPFKYTQLREPKWKDDEETRCLKALESLAGLQVPCTTVDIHIDLAQDFSDDEEYEELLDHAAGFVFRVMRLVDTLRMNGLKLELSFEGRWDGRDGTKLCSSSVSSIDDCITKMKIACQ